MAGTKKWRAVKAAIDGSSSCICLAGPMLHTFHEVMVLCHTADGAWLVPTIKECTHFCRCTQMSDVALLPSVVADAFRWEIEPRAHRMHPKKCNPHIIRGPHGKNSQATTKYKNRVNEGQECDLLSRYHPPPCASFAWKGGACPVFHFLILHEAFLFAAWNTTPDTVWTDFISCQSWEQQTSLYHTQDLFFPDLYLCICK